MPTRTEHIPCPTCGKTRPIVSPRPRDHTRPCRKCAANHRTPSKYPTVVMVPCIRCGQPRPIRAEHPNTARTAAKRQCSPCANSLRNTNRHKPEPDTLIVEFLIAGTMVKANAAERMAAVAYLTDRRLSATAIANRLHCTTRTVERHRAKLAAA
jgi:hypothetical protein